MKDFMIHTERLQIRILNMKDKEALYHYRSNPAIQKFQLWKPKSMKEIEEFIQKNLAIVPNTTGTWLQLAVCLHESHMIGDVGIHFLDDSQIEIGYTISPEYQHRGYATEAVKGVVQYCFYELKKHRITASVDPENTASVKLLEKIGFRKEAHFIKSFRIENQWYDDCIYSLLEDEWK